MKPNEYILKYKLNLSNKLNTEEEFIEDLSSDFLSLLEVGNSTKSHKGFKNAANAIKMKFDAISNKTWGKLPIEIWDKFNYSVIVEMEKQLFPEAIAKREAQKKRTEQREKERKAREERWNNSRQMNFEDFYSAWINLIFGKRIQAIPKDELTILGLLQNHENNDLDENVVKSRYRQLSKIHHPDYGGKQEDFITITSAKNKVLGWLQSKQN